MTNFTPISSLIGGLIIGSAVVLYFYTTGRLAGISGVFANGLTTKKNRSSNLFFLLGLVIGPSIYLIINDQVSSVGVWSNFCLCCFNESERICSQVQAHVTHTSGQS